MKKQLCLLSLLLFTFVSCDLAEIISGKKDDNNRTDVGSAPELEDSDDNKVTQGDPNSCQIKFYQGTVDDFGYKYNFCVYREGQALSHSDCDDIADNIIDALGATSNTLAISFRINPSSPKTVTLYDDNNCPNSLTASSMEHVFQSRCTYSDGLKVYTYNLDGATMEADIDSDSQKLCQDGGEGNFRTGVGGTFDGTNYNP